MLFRPHRHRKIEIDPAAVSAKSPEVTARLERIEDNYRLLDELWLNVEKSLPEAETKRTEVQSAADSEATSSQLDGSGHLNGSAAKPPRNSRRRKPR